MKHSTIVDVPRLQTHLEDAAWVVLDCRFDLGDPGAGERAYAGGHIPGARYAHLERDLAGPVTATSGRHPLPDPTRLAATLGRWGIGRDTQVVAYDDVGGAMAARAWWLLRWLGHEAAAVLDGGIGAWHEAGLALSVEVPDPLPATFDPNPRPRAWLSTEAVQAAVGDMLLVDARAAPRFRGEVEPIDPVAGHVPGAVNRPFQANLDANGRFLDPARLRADLEALLGGRQPVAAVHMCGSGVTACHNLLAMERAGLGGSRLYAGSWSEWIRDPARPVATGL